MPRQLFERSSSHVVVLRRSFTLPASLAFHAVALLALAVWPLFAVTELPPPHRPTTFRLVSLDIELPPDPPVRRAATPQRALDRSTEVAPIRAPAGIEGESGPVGPGRWPVRASADGLVDGVGDVLTLAPPPSPATSAAPPAPVRPGGDIRRPEPLRQVPPVYPELARRARVEGMVVLEATIGTNGKVTEVAVLRSVPLLDEAAVAAVRTWEYTPTLLNGVPVSVIVTVTVTFTLN